MTKSWTVSTLGEIAASGSNGLVDGPFGSNLPASSYRPSGVPVIRGSNLSLGPGLFKDTDFVFVDEAFAQKLFRSLCTANDILFTKKGTLGQTGFIPSSARYKQYLLSSNQMKLTVNEQIADPRFVYYYVSSQSSIDKIIRDAEATGVPKTNVAYLKSFPIFLPPIYEQRLISSLLSSLDDKIELNRRMNETLGAMAQAVFRDWFVDFGPTRRKLEGATNSLTIMGGLVQDAEQAQALAALFPGALGDDGLPEGWTFCRLEDVLELAYGKALPKGERRDGTIPVYGSGGVGGFHDTALASGPSVIVGRKGTVGSLYWEDDDFYPIDTVFYVKSKRPMTYCHQLLQTLGLETMNTDAAVPGLNRNNAYRLEVPQPHNSKLLSEFGEIADVLRSKTTANVRENRILAATRDLLLPKLMSGEIRLQSAEKPIEVRV